MSGQTENNTACSQQAQGLKHGQFKVVSKSLENQPTEYIINPHSQEEYADGWSQVLPRVNKNSTTHHFNVYLSQLPPHLWKLIRRETDKNGIEQYLTIFDNIYTYTITPSPTDDDVFKLYELVTKQYPNNADLQNIRDLHKILETGNNRVKGWLMMRAKKLF